MTMRPELHPHYSSDLARAIRQRVEREAGSGVRTVGSIYGAVRMPEPAASDPGAVEFVASGRHMANDILETSGDPVRRAAARRFLGLTDC